MYPPQIHSYPSAQPTSSPTTFPPPSIPASSHRSRPLTVQPNATVPPRGSTILTPPPSAHPQSQSSSSFSQHHLPASSSSSSSTQTPPPPPNHVPVALAHGVNASIQPATRLLNRQHVLSSSYPQHPPQQQQQQVLNQENGVVHAQRAPLPWAPSPPQVVTERTSATPKLRPATFPSELQQQQQQQQTMTHSTATTTSTTKPVSNLVWVRPNGAEHHPVQVQASTRGQQPVQPAVASAVSSALVMQSRPQRVMQPHTQMPERMQKPNASSSPLTLAQQQQQQQQQQDAHIPSPAVAAFKVLQPVKVLLEQTWATAMDATQREIAELNAEQIRSAHEQQRLAEMLHRCQVERAHALHALHETKAMLRESLDAAQIERRGRVQSERAFVEMSSRCTCGAVAVKPETNLQPPLTARPPRSPLPLPSSTMSSPLPSSPAVAAPTSAVVDGEDRAAARTPPVVVGTTMDKPRELRRGREEEIEGNGAEIAPKRRKITPPPPTSPSLAPSISVPLPSPAAVPTPVSEVVPTPEVDEVVQMAAKELEGTVVVLSTDSDSASAAVSASGHQPSQSAPAPKSEFTTPEPDSKPQPAQEENTEDSDPLTTAETDGDAIVSARQKIGIQHILLAYETVDETLQCRMCQRQRLEVDEGTPIVTFSISATYDELVGHCEQEHEVALNALAEMTPSDIAEMQQHLRAGEESAEK